MNVRAIAAVAGTAFALSMGSALAWDEHDTLAPSSNPTATGTRAVAPGADLQLPGTGSVAVRGAAYAFQCSEAIAKHGENSAQAATFC